MSRKADKTGRSKGEARHVRLYFWLMETPAWQSLDAVARAAYIDLASLYNGANNGKIARSVRDAAAALHVSPATAMRAHKRLEAVGFIVRETRGAFSRKVRHAAEWRLTEFNSDVTVEAASKDFARWKPEEGAQVIVVKHQNSEHGTCGETNCDRGETLGTCGETPKGKKGRLGACGETSRGGKGGVSGACGETHIVYQGESPSTAPAERGRSAPTGSAVASPRGEKAGESSSVVPLPGRDLFPALTKAFIEEPATLDRFRKTPFSKQQRVAAAFDAEGIDRARQIIMGNLR